MHRKIDSRCFVRPLLDWANREPDDRIPIRKLMDPMDGVYQWMRKLAEGYFYPSLNRDRGITQDDFAADCVERVLRWAKRNVHELAVNDFTDDNLEAKVRTISKNYSISLLRRMKDRYFKTMEEFQNNEDSEHKHRTPVALVGEQGHLALDLFPRIKPTMRRFAEKALKKNPKMLQTYDALFLYCEYLCATDGVSPYWLTYKILQTRGQQLSDGLRDYLKSVFPNDAYKVINSRIGFLRRALEEFLRK